MLQYKCNALQIKMNVCYFLLSMRRFNMHEKKNAICFAKPLIFNSITVILIKIEDVIFWLGVLQMF